MNLWCHCFSQNANHKFSRLLPYQTNKYHNTFFGDFLVSVGSLFGYVILGLHFQFQLGKSPVYQSWYFKLQKSSGDRYVGGKVWCEYKNMLLVHKMFFSCFENSKSLTLESRLLCFYLRSTYVLTFWITL